MRSCQRRALGPGAALLHSSFGICVSSRQVRLNRKHHVNHDLARRSASRSSLFSPQTARILTPVRIVTKNGLARERLSITTRMLAACRLRIARHFNKRTPWYLRGES